MQIRDDRIIRRLFEEVTIFFCHGCNLVFLFVLNHIALASIVHDVTVLNQYCQDLELIFYQYGLRTLFKMTKGLIKDDQCELGI